MKSTIENLEIYKLAERIEVFLYKLVKRFPGDERYRMVDQICRASNAITSNIAEGYGRYHYQEKIRYLHISRAEAWELRQLIIRAYKKDLIKKEKSDFLEDKITNLIKGINGYIRYFRGKQKQD